VTRTVGIIGDNDRRIQELVRAAGMRAIVLKEDQFTSAGVAPGHTPDIMLVDVRADRTLLAVVAVIKRRYPAMGVAIVAASLDPEMMLEAMRAGVSEMITEPLNQDAVETAIGRVVAQRAAPADARVYAVVGAKGGTGATTIAVNLAEALGRQSGDALLIDLQMAAGDAAVLLGVEPRFTIAEALENTHRLDEAFFRGLIADTKSGLDLLAAATRAIVCPVDPPRIRTLLDCAVRYYRSVVLDVPRGDVLMLDSLEAATGIFVVVNHELTTIRSAQRLVTRLRHRYGDKVGVVVNRSDPKSEITLEDIAKAISAPIRHVIPSDYRAALAAVNKGQPLAQSSQTKLGASFHDFARKLTGKLPEAGVAEPSGGILAWLTPRRLAS
jgi:pilus assembly protein CpaE